MKQLAAVFGLLLVMAVPTGFAWQDGSKVLDTQAYLELESIGSPSIAPDGEHILFTRRWIDKANDQHASNLWLTDINGSRVRELTHGNWRDTSPVWSPDGKKIAFLSNRDGTTQIHVMWMDTREVAQLTHLERAPSSLVWSPDGKMLAFTAFVPDEKKPLKIKLPKFPKGAKLAKPAVLVDRLSWRRDGRGFVPPGYTHIFTIDAELGGTPRQVTSGDYSHSDPQWSADGKNIYFSAIRKPDAEYLKRDSEIYSVDLSTLEVNTLTDRKGPDTGARISPDGRWIVYGGYDQNENFSNIASLYLMNSRGNGKKLLATDFPTSPSSITWAADSSGVYYVMAEKGESNLHFISTDGSSRRITSGVHILSGFTLSEDGNAAVVKTSFQEPGCLFTFNIKNPSSMKKLVDVNQDVLADVKLGDVEELWFKSPDGLDLQGWLIRPAEFNAAKKYPMVLYIHGGPVSAYTVAFNSWWQLFAAEGYAVLYMNPRGSTGYGQEFVNGINYAYPGKDYDDLMAAVDAAIGKGYIDTANLFVCGGSGGGVLTAWIVGHTDRFRAAVSMAPVMNWHSFVGTTADPVNGVYCMSP